MISREERFSKTRLDLTMLISKGEEMLNRYSGIPSVLMPIGKGFLKEFPKNWDDLKSEATQVCARTLRLLSVDNYKNDPRYITIQSASIYDLSHTGKKSYIVAIKEPIYSLIRTMKLMISDIDLELQYR